MYTPKDSSMGRGCVNRSNTPWGFIKAFSNIIIPQTSDFLWYILNIDNSYTTYILVTPLLFDFYIYYTTNF